MTCCFVQLVALPKSPAMGGACFHQERYLLVYINPNKTFGLSNPLSEWIFSNSVALPHGIHGKHGFCFSVNPFFYVLLYASFRLLIFLIIIISYSFTKVLFDIKWWRSHEGMLWVSQKIKSNYYVYYSTFHTLKKTQCALKLNDRT